MTPDFRAPLQAARFRMATQQKGDPTPTDTSMQSTYEKASPARLAVSSAS
jgi:hypothetical protein